MAVGVEQAHALTVDAEHPFAGQAALPLGCLTILSAEAASRPRSPVNWMARPFKKINRRFEGF
jgi:hypothetical protein